VGVEVVVVVIVVVEGVVLVVMEVVVVEDDVRIVGLVTPETVVPVTEGRVMLVAVVDEEADGVTPEGPGVAVVVEELLGALMQLMIRSS